MASSCSLGRHLGAANGSTGHVFLARGVACNGRVVVAASLRSGHVSVLRRSISNGRSWPQESWSVQRSTQNQQSLSGSIVTAIRASTNNALSSGDTEGSAELQSDIKHVPFRPLPFVDLEGRLSAMPKGLRTGLLAVAFALLASVAWFRNTAAAGLVDDTEPLFVEAARQMLLTGDFVTPQFNAQPRFDKPALLYWLAAAVAGVCGSNKAWAYRLPSSICASLLLWSLVKTVRQFGLGYATEGSSSSAPKGKKGSLLSCMVVACAFALSSEVVVWGSIGVSDMLLTATTGACLLSFFYGYAGLPSGQFRWGYPLAALFMALAVLTKGPVGVVVPVLVCIVFLTYMGELLTVFQEVPFITGGCIVLSVNLPWYLEMIQRHGRMYWATFFGYHNLERFTKGVNHHDGMPFWFSTAVVLGAHLPWSLAVPVALSRSRLGSHRSLWRTTAREDRLVAFAASWFLAVFAFFSMSASQLPSYYLPLSPAVALLAASVLTWRERRDHQYEPRVQDGPPVDVSRLMAASTITAYVLQAVALSQLPAILASSADAKAMEVGLAIAAQHLHWTGTAIFGAAALAVTHTREFSLEARPRLPATSTDATSQVFERKLKLPLWAVQAVTGIVFLPAFFTPVFGVFDKVRQQPLRQLAVTAARCQREGEPLCMVGPKMPSVVFYAQRPVAFFDNMQQATFALSGEAEANVTSALLLGDAADMEGSALAHSDVEAAGGYVLKRVFVPE